MNDISRRTVLGGLAAFTLASGAQARTIDDARAAADDGEILSQRYAKIRTRRR